MLTQSEREWVASHRTYCNYCDLERGSDDCEWEMAMKQCAMYPRMQDALEFSERVAVKMAVHHLCTTCPYPDGPSPRPCGWCLMKRARLEVEEEMDGAN